MSLEKEEKNKNDYSFNTIIKSNQVIYKSKKNNIDITYCDKIIYVPMNDFNISDNLLIMIMKEDGTLIKQFLSRIFKKKQKKNNKVYEKRWIHIPRKYNDLFLENEKIIVKLMKNIEKSNIVDIYNDINIKRVKTDKFLNIFYEFIDKTLMGKGGNISIIHTSVYNYVFKKLVIDFENYKNNKGNLLDLKFLDIIDTIIDKDYKYKMWIDIINDINKVNGKLFDENMNIIGNVLKYNENENKLIMSIIEDNFEWGLFNLYLNDNKQNNIVINENFMNIFNEFRLSLIDNISYMDLVGQF